MVRPTDPKTAIEKIAYYSQLPRGAGQGLSCHRAGRGHREAPESEGARERKGKTWAKALIVVSMGRNGRGKVSSLAVLV